MEKSRRAFTPITVGRCKLDHRIVMAPMTRMRVPKDESTPTSLMTEMYSQRAQYPGTLIISEGTFIESLSSIKGMHARNMD